MVRIRHQAFVAKCVRYSLAAIAIALFGAGGVAHASCFDCTFYGTDAGAGATGNFDSAFGFGALSAGDSTGGNTAIGWGSLFSTTAGVDNTATGAGALFHNTDGFANTATGFNALGTNTTGGNNTATGNDALSFDTGDDNTATGSGALGGNSTGGNNTASGSASLTTNTTGSNNTATGSGALVSNSTGSDDTATGQNALANTTGSNNIAIGNNAGEFLTTGNNDIDIGSRGVVAESNVIRLGAKGTQTEAFVQGIYDSALTTLSPRPVVVNSNGRLGYMPSTERYKRDIRDMGDASNGLLRLRPVSFRYTEDSTGELQYGLIAEDVERVYPELVTRDADGKVESVRYELLPAMLVNEAQKQQRQVGALTDALKQRDAKIAAMQKQIEALKKKDAQIDALAERMNALEQQARMARPVHLASTMR